MCCDDSCSDNCRVFFFCNITPFKNTAKDSLPCPDNTNKFILFWVKCNYISIYNKGFAWAKKPRESTFNLSVESLIDTIDFVLDNSYFSMGSNIFIQIVGVPIGMDPGPFIANLTLFYYEYKYLDRLYKFDYFSAKRLNNTLRLNDYITSIIQMVCFKNILKVYILIA